MMVEATFSPAPVEPGNRLARPMTVLLAYDGSEHAQAAVRFLRDLPIAGSYVHALAVMPTQYFQGHEGLQVALDLARVRLESSGLNVTPTLKTGNPAATINDYASEYNVDLIVMGAKGLRATLGILLGGVAQSVVEYSSRPVLVVRAPYRKPVRVLLVTDGSPYSKAAVEYLAPHCEPHVEADGVRPAEGARPAGPGQRRCVWLPEEATVQVLHVLPPPLPPDAMRAWAVGPEMLYAAPAIPLDKDEVEAEEERHGERILAEALSILEAAGIPSTGIQARGDAATEIIEHVQKHEIDLVVCGSRGLNPVTGWLLGSVSRKLVHYAGCSVLIVKHP